MIPLAFISNLARGPGFIMLLAVILLFGAKRLPELGRSIGQTIREFSKGRGESEDEENPKLPPKT